MPACSEAPITLVTFRGGFSADWAIVRRLLDLESRGARFELVEGGRFRVLPLSVLTAADVVFLRAHRDEAPRVLEYQTDRTFLTD